MDIPCSTRQVGAWKWRRSSGASKKAEHKRLCRVALSVTARIRNERQVQDAQCWAQASERFRKRHQELLESLQVDFRRYVELIAVSWTWVQHQFPYVLSLVQADACFGKSSLASFQVFTVVGWSSNFSIIALGCVLLCGNESVST